MTGVTSKGNLPKRIAIVYNPSKNMKVLEQAVGAIKNHGFELEIVATASFDDVSVQVNQIIRNNNIDLLLIGGGDGTILAAINGFSSFETPVGILPMGCSNDFCHALGIRNIDDAIKAVINGNTIGVDLGVACYQTSSGAAQTRYFCSTAGMGFIPAILKMENKPIIIFFKKLVKDGIWAILALYKIMFSKDIPIKLMVNQQLVYAEKTRLLEISKVKSAGGVQFTPDAGLSNKSFDFWFARETSFFNFLYAVIVKVTSPAFKALKQVTYFSLGPMRTQNNSPVRHIHVKADEYMPVHLNGEYIGECKEVSFSICETHQLKVLHNG